MLNSNHLTTIPSIYMLFKHPADRQINNIFSLQTACRAPMNTVTAAIKAASFINYSEKPPGVRLWLVLDPDSEADTLQFVCDPFFDFNQ